MKSKQQKSRLVKNLLFSFPSQKSYLTDFALDFADFALVDFAFALADFEVADFAPVVLQLADFALEVLLLEVFALAALLLVADFVLADFALVALLAADFAPVVLQLADLLEVLFAQEFLLSAIITSLLIIVYKRVCTVCNSSIARNDWLLYDRTIKKSSETSSEPYCQMRLFQHSFL